MNSVPHAEGRPAAILAMYFFSSIPLSMLRTLKMDPVNVKPLLLLTRDSQPSGIRSSIKMD